VLEETKGLGADRGCECVGYQAHDPQGTEDPAATLNMLIRSVRFTGGIGVVGGFVPADPGGTGDLAQQGKVAVEYGLHWLKGQTLGSGWSPVKKYNRRLRDLIAAGKANPSWIVSHELPLEGAVEAYKQYDDRSPGWTKVVLKPRSGE
jgi:glutathione-independent formaldehyde dehydrogenase